MTQSSTATPAPATNRSALWALFGVAIGFGLPFLAFVGFTVAVVSSIPDLVGHQPQGLGGEEHLSGPATGPAVAVIDVMGPILGGQKDPFDPSPQAVPEDLVAVIQRAGDAEDVRALLVRVNSPGGSVVGSDQIYHALTTVEKPVVALMQDVAASGGYYVSMGAEQIVVNANSLVGSIGVIGQFPDAAELMDKVGLKVTTIKSGESKDLGNPFRAMTAAERAIFQEIVDETYDRFVDIVATGRSLSVEQVQTLADGRIYTGEKAVELGLADVVGYQAAAVARAAELGGIEGEPRVVRYKKEGGLIETLVNAAAATGAAVTGSPRAFVKDLVGPSLEFRWRP